MHVNVDNFVRAETDRMFADLHAEAGGVNRFAHKRRPAAIDAQTVIRLNRDTLYSFAVVDVREGATVTIPDHGDRYLSVMVLDQDHHVRVLLHDPGEHHLSPAQLGTPYAMVAVRILVDPTDPADVAEVGALQDRLELDAGSAVPYASGDYDTTSLDRTRSALLQLAAGLTAFDRTFGAEDQVDPVRHLIGTAAGWGGLPTEEATYVGVAPDLPVGRYELTVGDVPVDGFWSISVYNAEGYFEPNEADSYTVNSVTGVRDDDGTITVRFGDHDDLPNTIPITEGWNYLVRLYRPRPEVIDGTWSFPALRES